MSAKGGKKKRLGSRRVTPSQNVTSDEIHVTDDTSVAQHHVLEESSESVNVLSNLDHSNPETQQPLSPDVTTNRRKLGSSRRNKGRQSAKDSETEPCVEPREEVEEKTRGNKTIEATQTSLTVQLDRQEELSQGSVQDVSATPKSSWSSASTPDYYYSEIKTPNTLNSPEDVMEISTPKADNPRADQASENETKVEQTDKSDTLQSAEVEENVGIPELSHLSALSSVSADKQLISIQPSNSREMPEDKPSHVYSVAEMGSSNNSDDADLFRQDGSLQGNTLESESQDGSVALESITDKSSPRENTAMKDSVEQAMFLLPKELFNLSELKDDQHLEDTVNKVDEQDFKATQLQKVHQDDYSPESLLLDTTENADTSAANLKDQAEIRDTYQFELSGEVTNDFAPKQEVSNPDGKQDEHPTQADNLEADFKVVSDNSVAAILGGVEETDTGAHRSEDDIQEMQEENEKTTEVLQIYNLAASVIDDATNNSEIFEVITTHSSEVLLKSTDDSATKQEVSNPDDKQDEHPTQDDNLEALDQRSEDYPSYDTKTPQISDIERVDPALVQVSESEGRVEDDLKPNVQQICHQELEQLLSQMEDSKPSSQSFQSETNVLFDSQPHDNSAGIDEEINTGFHQSGIRRKLGSSRRNKGKQHVKDNGPADEVDKNTKGHDPSETTDITLTSETADQEKSMETMLAVTNKFNISQTEEDVPVGTNVCTLTTTGIQSSPTVDQQVIDPSHCRQMPDDHSVTDTETKERKECSDLLRLDGNLPEDPLVSETHVSPITVKISTEKSSLEEHTATDSSPKDELPTNEEQLSDVRRAQHSEDAVKKMHEQDILPKHIQDEQQNDYSPESLILDATENVDTAFGTLKDPTEIRDTNQSELSVKVTDDSAPKQEVSNPDEKQDEHPKQDRLLEALEQKNEDSDLYDFKQPLVKNTEEDNVLGQRNEGEGRVDDDTKHKDEQTLHQDNQGVLSEAEKGTLSPQTLPSKTDAPFDSNPQDTSVSADEQINTGFNLSGNRRKLGSSRRNKGKQRGKDNKPTEEADGTTSGHDASETKITLTMETADQEKSTETMVEGPNKFDISKPEEENMHIDLHSCTSDISTTGIQSSPTVDNQETDLSHCKQMPDKDLLDVYSVADTEKGSDEAQQSEDAVKTVHEQEIKSTQMQETPQTDKPGSVLDDATENTETLIDQDEIRDNYQSKLAVKSSNNDTKERFESLDMGNEAYHVYATKKPQLSDTERVDTALGDVYETEGQVKDDLKAGAGKTGRQEAGLFSEMEDSESSLQSLQHELYAALDSEPQQNNTSFNSGGNTRELGSSQEKSMETMLEGMDNSDSAQIKDNVHVKQNEHFGPLDGISEFSSSSLHSSPAVDRQLVESNSSEMSDKGLPIVSSATENKEKDENTEPLRQDGRSQGSDLFSESYVESENIEPPTTTAIPTEKSSSREHTEVERSVEQSSKSSPKKELASRGEQNECFNPFTGAEHSEDVVNKVHDELINPIQGQELLQIDTGTKSSIQALPSDINTPLDSQSQDNPQSIKDETPTGPNQAGSRRKLGSSRRYKGRQHAKEETIENTRVDEASNTPNISLATETARQEELTDLKSPETIRKISFTVNEDENREKLPDKDTFFTDNSTVVTADKDFLKFNEDVDDNEKKLAKEPENLSHLTGYDTDKMDLMQPPKASVWKDDLYPQNISYHDDNENARTSTVDALAQGEESQLQNTEDLLGQDVNVQQTNDVIETVGHVTMESSVNKQGPGQGEDSTIKVDAVQEINTSHEPVEDVQSGISTAMDASNSQEEKTQSDYSKNVQVTSNQKRRKMGSTRRNQLNRKQEGETDKDETTESKGNAEADVRNLGVMEDVTELVLTAEVSQSENAPTLLGYNEQESNETGSAHDEAHQLEGSTPNLQSTESNVIPGRDDLMALLPEPSASHSEEDVDPDRKDGERNDVGVEPSQPDDFTSAETQITPVIDQLLPPNTATNSGITGGSSVVSMATESTQNDDERPKSAKVIQDQDSNEQKPNTVIEEAQVKIPETKSTSPNLTPTSRRRKMGSTRRNLGSRAKEEDLDNEATATEIIVGDVKTEIVPRIEEKDQQLHTEHKEGDPEQERLLETVEYSQVGETQLTPPVLQPVEENPVSEGQLLETEQLTPNYPPSTSPKNDTMSVLASGGRRRKMGSHRKSREHQGFGDQTEEKKGILDAPDVTNVEGEGAIKASGEHREESLGLPKNSEVDDKKPSSDIIISKAGEHSRPVSEKTPFQPSRAEIHQGQEQFTLAGEPRGAGLRSDSYHVVMIGDSSVGKTSFMKRAQTGKFSLDTPASIGLDSYMWTVVVDGKPVVLELWDTAGQERFRSITRHIFHRAQAFLLMYDITCTESFSAVSYWANCIQESAAEDVIVLLLGNKSDCAKRQVKTEQGEILAKEYNFEFMECSAATGENVVQSLEIVARRLNQRIGTREEAIVFRQEGGQKRSACC